MQKVNLLNLIGNVSSWAELETQISSLPLEIERGAAFEEFCKAFFLLEPVFQFQKVYNQKEIPPSLREQLGYPSVQDIGIDGITVTSDGKLVAYQAKFRRDRNNIPTLRELSTFFTVSDRADWRITITNANNLPSSINDRIRHSRVLADRFDQLDSDFFNRLSIYLKEQRVTPPAIKTPHKTQQEAIDAALSYFKEHNRGQLILPCGTGKTLAAMWIAEKMGGTRILVMVPSLALMSQTLREWAVNSSIRPFHYLCLCSDTTVDLGNDSPIEHLYEMDIPVTTDVNHVSDFLANKPSATSVLFSTYQSSKVLSEAALKTSTTFDIAVIDEAHRTTGTKVGVWNLPLDDKKVPIKRRLFMTATPRIYAAHIIKKAENEDVLICSMDDTTVYGRPFYEMTFGEAIRRGHITDYKVVVICVTDSEVRKIIEQGGRVVTNAEHEWDAKAFAKRVALVKGMNAYELKKVFTFHGRVNGAKAFTDTNTPYGIHNVFKMLEPENNNKKYVKFFHVNGTMSSGVRNGVMNEFKEAEIGIMSNARCLTEGVDVPAVDTVAFIDPKRSLIDIVQATGRAMRKAEWKEKGYIFIPVVVEDDTDPEKFIESSDFNTVWQVLQAMVDQDQRLAGIVSQLRIMQGKGEEGTQAWRDAMTEYTERIELYNLPIRIDKTRFINTLYTKTVEIISKQWDFWYGLTLAYKKQSGNANAQRDYETPEGYKLGRWQHNQRGRKHRLSSDKIQRLDEIGFNFDLKRSHSESFEKGFQEIIKYKEQYGNANAQWGYKTSVGYNLYQWQNMLRHRKNRLSQNEIQMLEDVGFKWELNFIDERFEKGFKETIRYKEQYGDPNARSSYKTPECYRLGSWQSKQRQAYKKGTLSPDRIKRLEEIGFRLDDIQTKLPPDESFEKGFMETAKYKEQYGNANVPHDYKTPQGYKLQQWQGCQRHSYKKGKLDREKIRRLEDVGFVWSLKEESFEVGLQETIKYKELFGSPNAPQSYVTANGFNLGSWQSTKRQSYKMGKLSAERIRKLEEVGFKWNFNIEDESFEKGFNETLTYKEQFGNANARISHKTTEGYTLGRWQSKRRQAYKNGKLSPGKIKRLEEIGFIFKPHDESFENGFRQTLKYKEDFGDPNAPDSCKLGKWQGKQRQSYKKGKLSPERIKRLEEIGFKWQLMKRREA